MKSPTNTPILVLALVIGCAAGAVWTRTSTAQAQRSDARRWEYCAIDDALVADGHGGQQIAARISYPGASGNRTEYVLAGPNDDAYKPIQSAISIASAKLGSEGWEMIGKVSWGLSPAEAGGLFFKRPK